MLESLGKSWSSFRLNRLQIAPAVKKKEARSLNTLVFQLGVHLKDGYVQSAGLGASKTGELFGDG
jgi:hypothetical protein